MIYGVELLEVIPHLETFVARDPSSRGNLGGQLDNQLVSIHTSSIPFSYTLIMIMFLNSIAEMIIPPFNCLPIIVHKSCAETIT